MSRARLESKSRQEHEELLTELGEALKPYLEDNKIYPDGSCLFRAVSWLASQEQDNHMQFHEGAVNSIEMHQLQFNEFLAGDGAVWGDLMRQSGRFGDCLAWWGLAEYIGMSVLVYRKLLPYQSPTVNLPVRFSAPHAQDPMCLLPDETPGKPPHFTALTIHGDHPRGPNEANANSSSSKPAEAHDLHHRAKVLRAEGKSLQAIARELNVRKSVIVALKLAAPQKPTIDMARVEALHEGKSKKEIAQALGVNYHKILALGPPNLPNRQPNPIDEDRVTA